MSVPTRSRDRRSQGCAFRFWCCVGPSTTQPHEQPATGQAIGLSPRQRWPRHRPARALGM